MGDTALVAVDVDGTLVGTDQRCSARNAAALRAVVDAGIEVLLVTARPSRTVVPLAKAVGLRAGAAICSLGAVLCVLPSGHVVESLPMSGDVATEIVRRLRASLPGILFGWDSGETLWYEEGYPTTKGAEGVARAADAGTGLVDPVVHLFARHPTGEPDWLEHAATLTVGLAETALWTGTLIDFTAKGVTKLAALQRYCAGRDIPQASVMALGDMPADAPMLRWAGRGIAVRDAHPEAIAAADKVVAACADDGAADALEALVRQG